MKGNMSPKHDPRRFSQCVCSIQAGLIFADLYGYPVKVRPSFARGNRGHGTASNREGLEIILRMGLDLSPVHEVEVSSPGANNAAE